jgi:hypothetical protein
MEDFFVALGAGVLLMAFLFWLRFFLRQGNGGCK